MNKVNDNYLKYRELFLYVIFGILTFLTDFSVFWILSLFIDLNKSEIVLHVCSVFATVIAITFAYITNRKIVFKSNNLGKRAFLIEMTGFFAARFFTMILAEILLQVMVFNFFVEEVISKIFVNVIVVVFNYIFSKLFIFSIKEKK